MCGSLYLGHFYVILFLRIVSKWQGTFQTWRHGRRAERGIPLLRPGCLSRVKRHSGQGMAEQEKITRQEKNGRNRRHLFLLFFSTENRGYVL